MVDRKASVVAGSKAALAAFSCLVVLAGLVGCGQKGPLRLTKSSSMVPVDTVPPSELPASGPVGRP